MTFEQAIKDLIDKTWEIHDFNRDRVKIVVDAEHEMELCRSRNFSICSRTNKRTIYGYEFEVIHFLEPLSELIPIGKATVPEAVSIERMKTCLYLKITKRNGRIEYIDSPICDEVYK